MMQRYKVYRKSLYPLYRCIVYPCIPVSLHPRIPSPFISVSFTTKKIHRVPMIIHLIDGTYELFRHFYGLRRFNKGNDKPLGAVVGVLNGVLEMIEKGATHLGVATDHIIESFRNDLWPEYKTGEGMERAL